MISDKDMRDALFQKFESQHEQRRVNDVALLDELEEIGDLPMDDAKSKQSEEEPDFDLELDKILNEGATNK